MRKLMGKCSKTGQMSRKVTSRLLCTGAYLLRSAETEYCLILTGYFVWLSTCFHDMYKTKSPWESYILCCIFCMRPTLFECSELNLLILLKQGISYYKFINSSCYKFCGFNNVIVTDEKGVYNFMWTCVIPWIY